MTGLVTVAGIPLWEARSAEQSADTVTIMGRECIVDFRGGAAPAITAADVRAAHDNIIGLRDMTVPVEFSDKTQLSGFYRVTGASSRLTKYASGAAQDATWSIILERVGSSRDVEIESRVPTIARLDEIAGTQTPVFWHAPAVGFTSYWTGTTAPSGSVLRVSSDGTVTVHTGIPSAPAPLWTVAVGDYLLGSSRILLDGIRRVGTHTPAHSSWRMHNGITQVAGEPGGRFSVAAWDSNDWRSVKSYAVTVNGTALTTTPDVSILRNDPEETVLRLSYPGSPGRTTLDLSLRRGSRFVTGVIKRHSSATLGVARTSAEAATAVTGGLLATAADTDGNRFALGSSRAVTAVADPAAISKAAVLSFDFFAGHEVGATPAAGDAFADLLGQYLAAGGELAHVVLR